MKRWLASLLILVMSVTCVPTNVFASGAVNHIEEIPEQISTVYVNPLYEDVISEEGLIQETSKKQRSNEGIALLSDIVYYEDADDAAGVIQDAMESRTVTVEIGYQVPVDSFNEDGIKAIAEDIFKEAVVHTGISTQGDYLRWQYGRVGISAKSTETNSDGSCYLAMLTFVIEYYTTLKQEQEVTAQVDNLLEQLNPTGSSYAKIKTVYDWICKNVSYDDKNLNDEEYLLKYTAYAALHDKTAVCQGYAVLLYRLALEMGIDCRLIAGIGNGGPHGWNIAKIGNYYYNLDATWDAGRTNYDYFLRNNANFTDHVRNDEYNTNSFNDSYPMSSVDCTVVATGTCGDDATWKLDKNGVLTISGIGEINCGWSDYKSSVKAAVVNDGITAIGTDAFSYCISLEEVELPAGLTEIKMAAFGDCGVRSIKFHGDFPTIGNKAFVGVMATVYYPCNNDTWSDAELSDYGGKLTWQKDHSFSDEWTIDAKATFEQEGSKSHHCTGCDERAEETSIARVASISLSNTSYVYNGDTVTPAVIVKDEDGNTLTEGTDYKVTYPSDRVSAKTYTVTVTGTGNYDFSKDLTFTIAKADMTGIKVTGKTAAYNGKSHTISISGVPEGATVTYKNSSTGEYGKEKPTRTSVGTTTVYYQITKENYNTITGTAKIVIKPADLTKGTATLSTTTYVYNGKVKTPSVTVKNSSGAKLTKDTHYTVTYASGRKAVGRYKVTVKGKGNYSGTITKYFTIVPKATASAKAVLYGHNDVKFSWNKVTGATGYKVYYKVSTSKTYTLLTHTKNTYYKKANLKDGKTYNFKVIPYYTPSGSSTKYYSSSAGKTASVTTLKKVSTPVISKSSAKKVKVKWTNIAGESGYQISKSTSKKGTSIVATYSTTSGNNKVISAKKGKTYYYKVRAYKKVGATKIYGPWSSVKKYKLK